MDKGTVGGNTELKALIYFSEQGYEVFRNPYPTGPIDIVAVHPDTKEILLIDVKTKSSSSALTARQRQLGVCLFELQDDGTFLDKTKLGTVLKTNQYLLENEIFRLMCEGLRIEDIAINLDIPKSTISKLSTRHLIKRKARDFVLNVKGPFSWIE